MAASVSEGRWCGEPALTLRAGSTRATFLPHLGMTGVSLRTGSHEFLATPGGPAALRAGHTLGLPLLAPWANRVSQRRFRVAGAQVDLRRRRLHTDGNGLPIHGFLIGATGWTVTGTRARADVATLQAAIEVDRLGFPFPHRLTVAVVLRDSGLEITTTVEPTGRRAVPIAFGWHPYLRLPGPRADWLLRLPRRTQLVLDARGLPTGERSEATEERSRIATRTFDDLYALGRDRRLQATGTDGTAVEVLGDPNFAFAQVWVPPGKRFLALEPMTAPTNALVDGTAPVVARGDAFLARFRVEISGSA